MWFYFLNKKSLAYFEEKRKKGAFMRNLALLLLLFAK